jgi:hydroxymethylbilane synthase
VGTGSPRRASQILARGYPVRFVPLRGNVDTRLRKLADGEVNALVLAVAGLARLDRLDVVSSVLEPAIVLPAPAQGALAVECRDDDAATASLLSMVDDDRTRATVAAERGFLAELDGGCTAPVGALAELRDTGAASQLVLDAVVGTPDGVGLLRRQAVGGPTDGDWLGRELARSMLHDGAAALLSANPATPDGRPPSLASSASKGEHR